MSGADQHSVVANHGQGGAGRVLVDPADEQVQSGDVLRSGFLGSPTQPGQIPDFQSPEAVTHPAAQRIRQGGRVRTDNSADARRAAGSRQRGTIDQLRERDRAQAPTATTARETTSDKRARERRERQERLKADLQALDQQTSGQPEKSSAGPAESGRAQDRRTDCEYRRFDREFGAVDPRRAKRRRRRGRITGRTDPHQGDTPASDRAIASAPQLETSTTPDRVDRPVRSAGRQRSEQDTAAIDRLRQQQEQRAERDKRYEQEDLERKRRIEERMAKRVQELKDEQEAAARKYADHRERRATALDCFMTTRTNADGC